MLWLCLLLLLFVVIDSAQTPLSRWQTVGMSDTGQYMTAAVYEGGIYISSDYGGNWTQSLFISSRWFSVAMSASGQYQMVTSTLTSQCAVSFDYGQTWTFSYTCTGGLTTYGYGFHGAMDATGQYRAVAMLTESSTVDHIFRSSNYGSTWSRFIPSGVSNFFPYGVAISGSGQYQLATNYYGSIYYSTNYGSSFSAALNGGGSTEWTSVAISYNGTYAVATSFATGIHRSTDYGVTWTKVFSGHFIHAVCEATGKYCFATDSYFLMSSSDYAVTWGRVFTSPQTADFVYQGLAISSSNGGMVVAAAGYGKCVFVSHNRGVSWSECVDTRAPTTAPTTAAMGPTADPTYAPSGPTRSPTVSSPASQPTFRPSTLAPTANATHSNDKGTMEKVTDNLPFSLSLTSLSTTNQIAIAVVLVLIICCCCIPAGYFLYRRNYRKDKIGNKKKGKKGKKGDLLVEDDGDIETLHMGKNGAIVGGSAGGTFGGTGMNNKSKDPTAALAARKKKKKTAPLPPPRHKKKKKRSEQEDEENPDVGEEAETEAEAAEQEQEEDTIDPAQSPLKPPQSKSGKLVQKKPSMHQIPRPENPPDDIAQSRPVSVKGSSSGGGFFSGFSSKSSKKVSGGASASGHNNNSSSSAKYVANRSEPHDEEEGDALIPSQDE